MPSTETIRLAVTNAHADALGAIPPGRLDLVEERMLVAPLLGVLDELVTSDDLSDLLGLVDEAVELAATLEGDGPILADLMRLRTGFLGLVLCHEGRLPN